MAEKSTKKAGDKAEASSAVSKKKPEKKKKDGLIAKVSRFAKELRSEIKKIVWPTPKTVFRNMGVVLVTIFVIGAFIFGLDTAFMKLLGLVMNIAG